jgi:PAS domain S-box-containing protein
VTEGNARQLTLDQAADFLRLPVASVEALVGAGYLTPVGAPDPAEPADTHLALTDLKAFLARNATQAADDDLDAELERTGLRLPRDLAGAAIDPQALLRALDGRSGAMAERAFEVFAGVFPEALTWPAEQRERFLGHARSRFEAILAVTGMGDAVDDELIEELADVGRSAARAGTPLPEVLVTLRISRDLVVQTAVEVAESSGRSWGLALSLLLTQVLPAMDRLTDAIATGYWDAVVAAEEESWARYEAVVEHATDGVFDIDHEGVVRYANPALSVLLGLAPSHVVGRHVTELLVPADPSEPLEALAEPSRLDTWVELRARRADAVEREFLIRVHERRHDGAPVGYAGVVRDVTADRDLARQKDDFLALMTQELRHPLTTVLGLGVTLDTYASELSADRVARMGRSIHQQAERIARLADDLFDVSRLEANTLMLTPRTVDVRGVVEAALGMLPATPGIEDVELAVPHGLLARADARRLEQVVAHLVENALVHGVAPVRVEAIDCGSEIELCVRDHGPGLPPGSEDVVFTRLHPSGDSPRYRDRASGLGLSLVRGLVEAMGGRAWYEVGDEGGATFLVTLPVPRAPGAGP